MMLLIGGTINAQPLGLKAGLNFANVSSEKDIDISSSIGFHAGVIYEVKLISLLNLGTGIYYTRRGYKSNVIGRKGTVSIDYLDVPIDFMLKFKLLDLIGVYVSAGPYFSYGVNSKIFDLDGVLKNGYKSDDINLNRIDSGFNVGAGLDLTNIRLSFAYGLSFIDNRSEQDNKLSNRILKISLGYFFD